MAKRHLTKRQKADLDRRTIADDSARQRVLNMERNPTNRCGYGLIALTQNSRYATPTQEINPFAAPRKVNGKLVGRPYEDFGSREPELEWTFGDKQNLDYLNLRLNLARREKQDGEIDSEGYREIVREFRMVVTHLNSGDIARINNEDKLEALVLALKVLESETDSIRRMIPLEPRKDFDYLIMKNSKLFYVPGDFSEIRGQYSKKDPNENRMKLIENYYPLDF